METLSNRSEIIDSFLLKDTDSIDEFSLKNDEENEETFVEEKAPRALKYKKSWKTEEMERIDPKTQPFDEYQETFEGQLLKQKSDSSLCKSDLNQSFNSGPLDPDTMPMPKLRIRKFSEKIRYELEMAFLAKNFISGLEKAELAKRLDLTERQVQKWFVHRREKLRRLEKKSATLNSTLNHHHSQIRSVKSNSKYVASLILDPRPKLIPHIRMLNANSYQKFYHNNFRADANYENMAVICKMENNFEYNEELDEEDYEEEGNNYLQSIDPENLNETEFTEENDWNTMNNDEIDENNFEENSTEAMNQNYLSEANPSYLTEENQSYLNDDNQNCLADETNYFVNNEENNEYLQENSGYLNDFENFDQNEMNFEAYDENSENFDESIDLKTALNRQKCLLDGLNMPSVIKQPSATKGTRRLFPPEVITHLEKVFDTEKYLKENQVEEIAQVTKLSEKQIRSWFKQRRYRYNQENKMNGAEHEMIFKKRDNLSQSVVVELEKAFLANNYIFGENKKVLSKQLNLKPIQLERWFYYRRKRDSTVSPTSYDVNQTL